MTHAPTADRTRSHRQRELINVAARLFAQKGYHAVGINDISGELGLTGPAFYRHYPSKEALLIAVLDDAISCHLDEVRELVEATEDDEVLEAIVNHHVAFVFDQSENIMTWRTEFRSIPESDRHRLRYKQRLYTEEWVRALLARRPELPIEIGRAMCHAAIASIQSPTEFHIKLSRAELGPLLARMAMTLLTSEAAAPARRRRSRLAATPA